MSKIVYVGMDVHKNSISIALADSENSEVRFYGKIGGDLAAVDKVVRKIISTGATPQFAYEAGPCGYGLYRHLKSKGFECMVVAPSLIPKKVGERIKTDRRDAKNLARLFRSGDLTSIYVPTEDDEAIRDLVRCREDAVIVQRQVRQRLNAFLLRLGRIYQKKTRWTKIHMNWLSRISFDHPAQQITFQEYIDAIIDSTNRVERITKEIRVQVGSWARADIVHAFMSLRGVSFVTAVVTAAELGDLRRFKTPKHLMAYLGLIPSEHSSGDTVRRGAITKTGNKHVRRVLVEAAWSYKMKARKTNILIKRQEGLSKNIKEISWNAQIRLCGKYRLLSARGKTKQNTVTAIARELSGFIWAIDREVRLNGAREPQ